MSANAPEYTFTQLTPDSEYVTDPAISRDGKWVAYASYRAGNDNRDIWVREIDGGNPVRLTSGEAEEYEPTFSPDNRQIAFRSDGDNEGIYVVSAAGGPTRLLAKSTATKFL